MDNEWVVKVAMYLTATFFTVIITMIGFWLVIGRDFVSRAEVYQILSNENKYIIEQIQDAKSERVAIAESVRQVSTTLNELKIQIAVLNRMLEEEQRKNKTNAETKTNQL